MAEHRYDPDYVVAPGETLAEWLGATQLTKSIASGLYGFGEDELDGILAGTEPITGELARKLFDLTGVSAAFWEALEHNFRVGLAAGKSWESQQ